MRTLKFREAKGGVAAAKGFSAAGAKSIGVVLSDRVCSVGAAFSGKCECAPNVWSKKKGKGGEGRAVVFIGNASKFDLRDVEAMAVFTASDMNIDVNHVLMASSCTGKALPLGDSVREIVDSIDELSPGESGGKSFADSMAHPKAHALKGVIDGCLVTAGGVCSCSGAGGSVVCIITTDIGIKAKLLEKVTKELAKKIFCKDTCGSFIILANGARGTLEIKSEDVAYEEFKLMIENLYGYFATPSCSCHR